jgi:uncharacterized protein (DUF305 family)
VRARGGGRPRRGGSPPRVARAVLPALLTALAVLGPLGCAGAEKPEDGVRGSTAAPAPTSGRTAGPAATGVASGGYNATDLAWAQIMVPMDERTLLLLDLIAGRAGDPGLSALARRTSGTHRAELPELRAVLTAAGASGTNPHDGMDMKGMVTDEELEAVAASSGAAFDTLARTYLREHFEQSLVVARGETHSGASASAKRLAAELTKRRTGQLAALRALDG